MEVIYHPLVQRDAVEIARYYQAISARLANEFEDELRTTIAQVKGSPLRFPLIPTERADRGFRRANLKRFPYHVLYEVHPDVIRVMLVRHNKRSPRFGFDRL